MGVGIIPLSFSIDAATFGVKYVKSWGKKSNKRVQNNHYIPKFEQHSVSVIVPAYNAEKSIRNTIMSIYGQNVTLKTVIVVDDCSTDKTPEICRELECEKDNFFHMRREKNAGKAMNINYVVQEFKYLLGDITVVIDSDIQLNVDCIEKLMGNFTSENVAAVTPYGYTLPPENSLAKALHYGNSWNDSVFKIRKEAQNYRSAISVICGAGTAYRTDVLEILPIPTRTKTEDTDYTWLLQEHGYKVQYDPKAVIYSHDLKRPRKLLRQWYRWYSGTFQSLFVHGKDVTKAKKMFWTTILPSLVESLPYALGIVTLPIIFAVNLIAPGAAYPFGMNYVKGFLLADFLFTTIPTAIISPKYLRHILDIYMYKFVGSALTLAAFARTTYDNLMHNRADWNNIWSKNHGFTRNVFLKRITKDYMVENLSKFFSIEENWTGISEQPWNESKFLHEMPKKWTLSFAAARGKSIIGYVIGSQANESTAKINKIVVDKKYQNSGIGKVLLWAFEEECARNSIKEIELKALLYNRRANRFYIKHGYVPFKTVKGTDGKTRIAYRKELC